MTFININNKTLMFFLGKILPKVDPKKMVATFPKGKIFSKRGFDHINF
jgi:hypothetical protein